MDQEAGQNCGQLFVFPAADVSMISQLMWYNVEKGGEKMEKILNEILSTLKDHSKRFDSIDEKFDSIDERFVSIDAKLVSIDESFNSIGGDLADVKIRLGSVEDKIISVDGRLDSVEDRLTSVDGRLDSVDDKLVSVDGRLGSVDDRLQTLSEQIDNNATEFRSHFKHIETKLEQHEETFHLISDTLIGTQIDIEHLSKKSGLHETEINQLKKRIHS
ncbi:hypothetical protein J7I93_13120 [Bacillus sp. ISL-47]|uniref:hypothetical protein n=1 Tax=Bacillus sp. ISL-47 TaxID=2819130 RepID=UPI001BEB6AD3|nr:hypothetical protein [Bacillus sp. ISL-47]MBT2689127.1 hypothetical protein [Bacillus sp. ISL-47]MBT2708583.1 hypothetical protein [Pseudomonas sp. ISL-84]